MPYPILPPTTRTYDPGDWPVKTFNSQNGAEVRMIYGNTRTNVKLQLSYNNITDSDATEFLNHYNEQLGTYKTFQFTTAAKAAISAGWQGDPGPFTPPLGVDWRYAEAPKLQAVRPGISSVTVNLIGVI